MRQRKMENENIETMYVVHSNIPTCIVVLRILKFHLHRVTACRPPCAIRRGLRRPRVTTPVRGGGDVLPPDPAGPARRHGAEPAGTDLSLPELCERRGS